MDLERYLLLSATLFVIGMYGALSRRNIITVLMSIEIMFNAVILTLVAMSRFITPAAARLPEADPADVAHWLLTGQTLAVFIVVVAAAEVALGLALVISLFRHNDTVDVTEINLLRH
jgi:NADH:ubiquinone oxidoreductase subunit K